MTGSRSQQLYFIKQGQVAMMYGGVDGILINIYEAGSFFGEIELLNNSNRNFTCVTLTPCKFMTIDKKKFNTIFFKKYPRLGQAFMRIVKIRNEGLSQMFEFIKNLTDENSTDHNSTYTDSRQMCVLNKGQFNCTSNGTIILFNIIQNCIIINI